MGKFFDDIKEGLEEAIDFEQGKTTLRTHLVELPEPPTKYTSETMVKAIYRLHAIAQKRDHILLSTFDQYIERL